MIDFRRGEEYTGPDAAEALVAQPAKAAVAVVEESEHRPVVLLYEDQPMAAVAPQLGAINVEVDARLGSSTKPERVHQMIDKILGLQIPDYKRDWATVNEAKKAIDHSALKVAHDFNSVVLDGGRGGSYYRVQIKLITPEKDIVIHTFNLATSLTTEGKLPPNTICGFSQEDVVGWIEKAIEQQSEKL